MSKPWGGAGAWALDAEQAEEEARDHPTSAGQPDQSFPSLHESAVAATKPKKKKPVTMSLSELTTGTYVGPGGGRRQPSLEPKGLTTDELLRLPTGPRERSAEELQQARFGGGGFRSYGLGSGGGGGGGGGGFSSRRPDEGRRSYGGGGGYEDEPRRGAPPPRASDLEQSSRADEDDNWGANKRSIGSIGSGRNDRDRYSALGGTSKADEHDDWFRGKQPMPPRQSSFGSGFRDYPAPMDSDRWVRGGTVGGSLPYNAERRKLVLEPPKRDTGEVPPAPEPAKSRPSPFGAARPREEILAEKGLDWKKIDTEIDMKKSSRPTSSQSSRPSSAQSNRPSSPGSQGVATPIGEAEGVSKSRPKVNPFGDAKPREVILEEKGKDWRKIDMELERPRVDRPESDIKHLKDEIAHLRKELEEIAVSTEISDELVNQRQQLLQREKELGLLMSGLDDKIRYGEQIDARPGSGSGRTIRSSQSSLSDESRTTEFERSRSYGVRGDVWGKPTEQKWGFQGVSDRGSFGNRNSERSSSKGGW